MLTDAELLLVSAAAADTANGSEGMDCTSAAMLTNDDVSSQSEPQPM